jgi:ABC-type bacteriocin/lantibiotic exporter with double-glycine peptidase domain
MKSRLLLFAILAASSQGCVLVTTVPPLDPLPKREVVLRTVPYTPQERSWDCGPACLASVMRHHGSPLTLGQVKSQLKQRAGGGIIIVEMIFGARKNGFRCTMIDGSLNALRRSLHAGKPLILFLHPMPAIVKHTGRRRGHYVVAVGYNDDTREFTIHSGETAFDTMSYRQLQLQWSRANFLALLIEK